MSNSMTKLYDEYEIYEEFCKKLNVKPVGIYQDFATHEYELMKTYGYKKSYDEYIKIK